MNNEKTSTTMGLGKIFAGLFGGKSGESAPGSGITVEHKGFTIRPTPRQADGQWQVVGVISRDVDGETREETFIRADKCASADEAVEVTLRKGRQIIDEQGMRLFSS
ncbi:HlyU family transcriptional regulator [Hongsoonwoonella zoysiae]|uniref:HlyU family transcriptional regulator n=1 Tax=Hongsoonwoonella zoysiae TaxID=2821844 RepID=UPI001FEB8E57|nr:HlyU family transcriptional regulator [Hongsoonwoonella zoysiae]